MAEQATEGGYQKLKVELLVKNGPINTLKATIGKLDGFNIYCVRKPNPKRTLLSIYPQHLRRLGNGSNGCKIEVNFLFQSLFF